MDDDDCCFTINKDYAQKYNKWREKEEYQKLKDRYGDADELESSSSSESEDEDAEALTPQVEKDWLRAYAAVKTKNPIIYKKDVQFFKSEEDSDKASKSKSDKKEKPMYPKDFVRKVIIEKGGKLEDEEDDSDYDNEKRLELGKSYYEEQQQLKRNLKDAIVSSDDEEEEEDFFKVRKKTSEEEKKEESAYLEWLKGQKSTLPDKAEVGVELESLKEYWSNPNLDEGEQFLKDYILNKRYIDEDEERLPTYDEIVNEEDFSDEEEELERQEEFERKYNFRFEEPDSEFVKSFPREINDTVRRKNTKRTDKRQEVKLRKEKEKEKKREELKKLKNIKRKQIMEKIEQLKEITGNPDVGFTEADLEGDFDPTKYDKLMKNVFDEDYYEEEEGGTIKKPVFSDDEDLEAENWDEWTGPNEEDYTEGDGPYCDDPDFNMDADFDPNQPSTSAAIQKEISKKARKRSKFSQALAKKKPVFDPSEKSFEEYFDEYYKLDYEDIIGDLPCRFKYRKVVPNDFGLSTEEILAANTKELNSWASVKKMSQIRTEREEMEDVRKYQAKGRNMKKKLNILRSLAVESEDEPEPTQDEQSQEPTKKKKKKKKKKKTNSAAISQTMESSKPGENMKTDKKRKIESTETSSPVKKMKLETSSDGGPTNKIQSPGKSEKKQKKGQEAGKISKPSEKASEEGTIDSGANSAKKKKKKNKNKNIQKKEPKMSDERLKAYGINPKKFKYMDKDKFHKEVS